MKRYRSLTGPASKRPEVITFDCYGTLIDWETGIRNAFRAAMNRTSAAAGLETRALELYGEEERRIEREKPHMLYSQVLSKTALAVARKIGWSLNDRDSNFLSGDLPNWKPFKDTNPALERLAVNHSLGILSNVDDDLLAGTLKHLARRFDILVTAEKVRSYKPAFAHFEQARRLIGEKRWLHVAQSQYHDIEPAMELGIRAVWVNRKNAQPAHDYSGKNVTVVRDLGELVNNLDA